MIVMNISKRSKTLRYLLIIIKIFKISKKYINFGIRRAFVLANLPDYVCKIVIFTFIKIYC